MKHWFNLPLFVSFMRKTSIHAVGRVKKTKDARENGENQEINQKTARREKNEPGKAKRRELFYVLLEAMTMDFQRPANHFAFALWFLRRNFPSSAVVRPVMRLQFVFYQ